MAGAFIPSIEADTSGDNLVLNMQVIFFAAGLKDLSSISVEILPADTLAQIKAKVVSAITAEAVALGYTVPPINMIIPTFQRGA